MSLLDIDIDKIDLGVIKSKLQEYMIYYYGDCKNRKIYRGSYITYVTSGDFKLIQKMEIYEPDLKNLVMYYLDNDPSTIYITWSSIVYRREWRLLYVPITISSRLRLLTLKNVWDL